MENHRPRRERVFSSPIPTGRSFFWKLQNGLLQTD
jgi:hypothetical protein